MNNKNANTVTEIVTTSKTPVTINNATEIDQDIPVIFEYVYNKRRNPVGIILAAKLPNGNVRIGHSRAKVSAGDKFERERGLELAINRTFKNGSIPVPDSMLEDYENMVYRASRYFKVPVNDIF